MTTATERRIERRNQVQQLHDQGASARKIARELGIDHKTVTADLKVIPDHTIEPDATKFNPTPTLASYKYSNACQQRAKWDHGVDREDFPALWQEYLATQNTSRIDSHMGHERRFLAWMKSELA
jgi:IS30 family transposase